MGYNDSTITPGEIEIVEGTNQYSFTIGAAGTLTIHVSDDGTNAGVAVEGATFIRCDAEGNTYGDAITSDVDGNAVFNNVPFATEGAPLVYYKQTSSDGAHIFSAELRNTALTVETVTIELANEDAAVRTINLTDTNYSGLPIADGQIKLNS